MIEAPLVGGKGCGEPVVGIFNVPQLLKWYLGVELQNVQFVKLIVAAELNDTLVDISPKVGT